MIKLTTIVENTVPRRLREAGEEEEFKYGYALGKRDRAKRFERNLGDEGRTPAFIKGYEKGWKEENRKRRWPEWNDKLTDLLGRIGSSRLREDKK